ncbi:MAG: hypothetical protein A2268_02650 [Candidatus Raymondbacteria bacterium RifOxyA12_full_50_37]|uniref:DNA 3'-5' helicase n=1 Tax=Candidatus Raymondbacteria bacterium RIFOXYD12_FULL_49_13 TaxID=1817890 RepID=A0A1F7F5V1_UNCRA|nr:MAG: hypothetical protein A2268_02650 [Candidatus Raymondbacteria bacterium RifOxyA12_full_50_37]OGJ89168.1 MAG: hypothetical protein A2248_11470 [Candidatus Raymondbacteria bacterium RIFOXYA2_FULL_49_16]OGJ96650.1 MAG: hypothetical protein A2453_06585 [Candidatus Raymondbacteria bacterium RIFOXYC2_FULL_50_21]OGK00012.1 MAG: hypothetical protein A2350_21055 [Candidatus Raymondbacteria bacterium RifOxyB12_full_50_8]OGK01962.1 MAG: hypothetical protein A2519_17690 [Candidatus Raymondbacteria b
MTGPIIDILLNGVNPEQRRAILHDHAKDGPLLVLAGAGTGKTSVITRRIAYCIANGANPASICAVTFTRAAALEMKERTCSLLERCGLGRIGATMTIATFHSLALSIVKESCPGITVAGEGETRGLLRNVALQCRKSMGEPAGALPFFDEACDTLERLRSHFESPETIDFDAMGIRDNREYFRALWKGYSTEKKARNIIDFNDMISRCLELLRDNAGLLDRWRNRFTYIHIDEYQDTNIPQYALSRMLAGGNPNVFIVGDDDQSIYRFRGADVSNILKFQEDYPRSTMIKLETNYRSTPNILALANAIFKKKKHGLRKQLKPNMKNTNTHFMENLKIRLFCGNHEDDETTYVLAQSRELINTGAFSPADITILCRMNYQVDSWKELLRAENLPLAAMTLHSAKGLEFPVVFYAGLNEGLSPLKPRDNTTEREQRAHLDEETRLFYVGVTRAKYLLFLTSAREQRWYGKKRKFARSRFFSLVPRAIRFRRPLFTFLRDLLLEAPEPAST